MKIVRPHIVDELKEFSPISLAEMDGVKLMNRTDTKFVFKRSALKDVLADVHAKYKVLKVENNLVSTYKTLYFDTEEFKFFLDHHNGHGNRYKVRIRQYVESNLYFLEIKNKYKGRTEKVRIPREGFEQVLSPSSVAFIDDFLGEKISLEPKLWNTFQRVTLVNNEDKERVTLDLGVDFSWEENKVSHDHIVIAELKQEYEDRDSSFYSAMRRHDIRPNSISKYCVGAVGLYPELKYNNFKRKLILINKLS
jgi:hypothetical protein